MALPLFLSSIEGSAFSTWLRESESPFVFYFVLLFHTFGLGMLVGANGLVDLRLLGFLRGIPLAPLKRFFRIMWIGFSINVVTGVLLIVSYPTKALTNPVFYAKLAMIGFAVWVLTKLQRVFTDPPLTEFDLMTKGATLAKWSLGLWIGTLAAGRLLAYTFKYILYPA